MAVYLDSELAEKQCQCPRCVVEREAWVAYIAEKKQPMSRDLAGWAWLRPGKSYVMCSWCREHNKESISIPRGVTLLQVVSGLCDVCNHAFEKQEME